MRDRRKWGVVARLCLALLIAAGAGATPAVAGDPTRLSPDPTHSFPAPAGVETAADDTGANDTGTTVSVTVAGERVRDGGEILTSAGPRLGVSVAAPTQIRLVTVRIDGETYRSYVPNATATNQSTTLAVGPGAHDVKTVVSTENRTRTHEFVLTEDSSPPRVAFRDPFATGDDTASAYVPNGITVDSSRVRFAGAIADTSNITRVEIHRESYYRRGPGGEVEYDQNRIVLTDVNGSFEQPLELVYTENEQIPASPTGESTNYVEISVRDEFDQRRTYEFYVAVSDDDGPAVTVTDTSIDYGNAKATVTFDVTDDVGIRTAGVTGEPFSLFAIDPARQPRQATFTHTFSVNSRTEVVRFAATDAGGTTTAVEREFDRSELIAPRIDFNTNRTTAVRRDAVRVVGTVAEGAISSVRVETVAPDGRVLDIETAHAGRIAQTVAVNETLETSIYPSRVRIRAVDAQGEEHVRSITLSVPPGQGPGSDATNATGSSASASNDTDDNVASGPGDSSSEPGFLSGLAGALSAHPTDYLLVGTILLLAGAFVFRT